MPTCGASSVTAFTTTPWCSRRPRGSSAASPPRAERFFLDVADDLQLRVLGLQPRDLALLRRQLPGERVGLLGLGTALLRSQPLQFAALTSMSPRHQVRRVQTLASKQSADLTGLRAGVGLLQDLPLVLGGEAPPLGLGRHFRRGARGNGKMVG